MMSVRYVFENLTSVADYLYVRAKERRESGERYKPRSYKATQILAEASTYENIADMLRNTKLRTDVDVDTNE